MSEPSFESHAQNGEDVVLWRALSHVVGGRYVEVGANDPQHDSVTRSFYDRGWSGVTVEPVPEFAARHRTERPRDTMVETIVTATTGEQVTFHHIPDSGLSTMRDDIMSRHREAGFPVQDMQIVGTALDDILTRAGCEGQEIQFVVIDVEGAEADVLAGFDLTRWRPWILVVESTQPLSSTPVFALWEPGVLEAGYVFCHFDGLSRFYVAQEHARTLAAPLSYPAGSPGVLDNYVRAQDVALQQELAGSHERTRQATADAVRWRSQALTVWAEQMATSSLQFQQTHAHAAALEQQMAALRATLSWRVTAPLRWVRTRQRSS